MTKFVKDKSANILNFLAMNRIVTQFSQAEEGREQPAVGTLNISNETFAEFFYELNELEVHYLAIGYIAGAYHGYPRACGSVELWLAYDDENLKKLQHLLHLGPWLNTSEEGQRVKFRGETFNLTTYLRLLHYSQHEFYRCYAEAESAIILNTTIPVLGKRDFIREKMSSPRSEDRKMIEALESHG
ncbi:hypothetical protein GCM10009122_35470 [Fulvivirga kasyanovii]